MESGRWFISESAWENTPPGFKAPQPRPPNPRKGGEVQAKNNIASARTKTACKQL